MSRPDPVLGQLQPGGNFYGLIPLVAGGSFSTPIRQCRWRPGDLPAAAGTAPDGVRPSLSRLLQPRRPHENPAVPPYYFLTIGNPLPDQRRGEPVHSNLHAELSVGPCQLRRADRKLLPPAGGVLPHRPRRHGPLDLSEQDPHRALRPRPRIRQRRDVLGLPPPARQPVRPRLGGQPHDRGRRDAVSIHRGGGHRGQSSKPHECQPHFLVPAAPAVPGRTRGAHARRDRAHSIRATATASRSPCRPPRRTTMGQYGGQPITDQAILPHPWLAQRRHREPRPLPARPWSRLISTSPGTTSRSMTATSPAWPSS